jgi:hypothetical protein
LRAWFNALKSGKGPCCSDADGSVISDADWESGNGHYRVRIDGEWVNVPDEAVITEPNRVGRTMVWPIRDGVGGLYPLFHAGQHDLNSQAHPHANFLSRSSSSIEMPCGPRMKQMRTPGRIVVGSLVNSTPLALISAATASMSFTVSPKWSSP